jgi:RNA polymerase sigma factor (sigma-70 family)
MIYSMNKPKSNAADTAQAELNPPALEALFAEHWAHVFRVLCRLVGDPAEAEDLALETFFRLYRHGLLRQKDFNFGGWLHRVAVNLGLQSIRAFKRREHHELEAGRWDLQQASEAQPAEILAQEEERRLVRLVLSQMNERQAQLLNMRYSGAAYKEIAGALGLSSTSVGPLLLRAEREFEKRYLALVKEKP